MSKRTIALGILALGLAFFFTTASNASIMGTFLDAQRCHINGTVDYACFQKSLARFEQFVLKDDAGWLPKSIVADGLVKTYDALHITSASEAMVRAKEAIYLKANAALDKSELGEIDDCRDEASPDGCLRGRYCFKEGYIKVKNVLVTNQPELFAAEMKWFDRESKSNC